MNKITKAYDYYKNNGSKAFLSRVKMHFAFVGSKDYINNNGIYKLKKRNKNIVNKSKDIYIISKYKYYESKIKEQIEKLNNSGYAVHYYHLNKDDNKYNYLLPVCENKEIKDLNIIKNKVVITEGNLKLDKSNTNYKYNIEKVPKDFINNISIIVLNYNNKNIIDRCIDSLIKYNKYKYEIIVVDNGSKDGSYELLKEKYKNKIVLLKNDKNGCSSGRNLGVKNSIKDYLLFLDSDQIVLDDNWLDNYLKIINKNNAIGWTAGWFNKKNIAGQIVDNFELRCMPPKSMYRTDIGYLGSGGLMISRKLFDKTEGFDINYDPTGYEDTDFSLQIRNLGYELIYCPYLGLIHEEHQTTSNVLNDEKINKNANYFKNKWLNINKKLLRYKR